MARKLLLTLDEARAALCRSALGLIRNTSLDEARLLECLWDRNARLALPPDERARVSTHRTLINALRADGLSWLVEEELEGICSYAGLIWEEAAGGWQSPLASGE